MKTITGRKTNNLWSRMLTFDTPPENKPNEKFDLWLIN